MPVLASLEEIAFLVIMLLGGLVKSIMDSRKREQQKQKRRSPSRGPIPGPRPELPREFEFPIPGMAAEDLPELEYEPESSFEPEPEPEPEPAAMASTVGQGFERSTPLGLDLQDVQDSLPSHHEESFESHKRTAGSKEGRQDLAPIQQLADRTRTKRTKGRRVTAGSLRQALIMAEILGTPVALREKPLTSRTH